MTDQFNDVVDEETSTDSTTDSGSDEQTTVTDTSTSDETFTDGTSVRSTLPDPDGTRSTKRYADPDSTNEADDVDARGLFRTPSINEIRYYAREGPYGRTIVHKPIQDAFKHGFTIDGDPTSSEERNKSDGVIKELLVDFKDVYVRAQKKARRDGMAVVMHTIADDAASASEPIDRDTASHEGFQLWTIDNLSDDISVAEAAEHVEYDSEQLYLSEGEENGGIVIVDDIGHPDHGDVVGYGIEPRKETETRRTASFVHGDRCQQFVYGDHVDGPLNNDMNGQHIGESVLTPVLRPLMAAQMGYWALQNILLRYSAPLHAVEPPESWGMDDWDEAEGQLENISMSSDALLPPGSELNVAEGVSEFDPEPYYDVLVESICAGTIFTKSVLQGTQTGTVSGSETDVKGYFNGVELLRTERIDVDFRDTVQMVSQYDQEKIPRNVAFSNWEIDWGPLFKPTDMEQVEGAVSLVTGLVSGIKQYVLTPDEARSIMEEEWADFDMDVSLDALTEEQRDRLDRINVREVGRGPKDDEPVTGEGSQRENPHLKNGGGQPPGQNRESSQPVRDGLDDEEIDEIVDRLADRLDE